jgi:hypothetical protein
MPRSHPLPPIPAPPRALGRGQSSRIFAPVPREVSIGAAPAAPGQHRSSTPSSSRQRTKAATTAGVAPPGRRGYPRPMSKALRVAVVVAAGVLPFASCGGDDDDGGASAPACERLAKRMCDAARSCVADPSAGGFSCRWYYSSGNSLGRNCPVCEGGLVNRFCDDPTKTAAMIDACLADIEGVACETPEGDEPGARVPASCDVVMTCGGGPCAS